MTNVVATAVSVDMTVQQVVIIVVWTVTMFIWMILLATGLNGIGKTADVGDEKRRYYGKSISSKMRQMRENNRLNENTQPHFQKNSSASSIVGF